MKRKIYNSKRNKGKKNSQYQKTYIRLGAIIFFLVILGLSIYYLYRSYYNNIMQVYNSYEPAFAPGDLYRERVDITEDKSFNLLVLGLDQKESGHIKTDAVFIIHYDSIESHFQVFEIPSGAKYYWPEKNDYLELANIYALGQLQSPESGYWDVEKVLEYNLSLKIDGYVAVDMVGLTTLIDDMGILTVWNEKSFTDNDLIEEGLTGTFDSGSLHLSPDDLASFVRADEDGFYAKSLRHYSVIRSIVDSAKYSDVIYSIGAFRNIDDHIYSNMTGDSIRHFIRLFTHENSYVFDYYQLDSIFSLIDGVNGEVFDQIKFDGFVASTFDNSEIIREQARIEIYNATDISGLASSYSRILQNMGCDIIRKSNTSIDISETIIFTETPDLFPLTIDRIKSAFSTDISVVHDNPGFVTTGDLIIVLADDSEII